MIKCLFSGLLVLFLGVSLFGQTTGSCYQCEGNQALGVKSFA